MACYFPNHEKADGYTPCDSGAKNSHCCAPTDYCYTNGLCFDPQSMTNYRGACTDKSWDSQACSSLCLQYTTYSGVWPCGDADRNWACNPPDCQNASLLWQMTPGKVMQNKALDTDLGLSSATGTRTATSSVPTAKPTSGNTTAAAASSPGAAGISADDTCPSHAGAMAGIGVGIGLPLLIALAVLSWFWLRDRKKVRGFQAVPTGADSSAYGGTAVKTAGDNSNSFYEPKWMRNELPPTSADMSAAPRYSNGGTAYPSELPNNIPQDRSELDTTTFGSRA